MEEFRLTFIPVTAVCFWSAVFAVALTLIPFSRLALRFGMVDCPDRFRKLHTALVPIGGSVLIIVTLSLLSLIPLFQQFFVFPFDFSLKKQLPLFVAVLFLGGIGIIDDKWRLNGSVKLCCQVIAASIVVGFMDCPTRIAFFGWSVNLHHLFYPFAVFWLIGMINSINLLDGADGVASTVSFFLAVSAALLACINGHWGLALCCIVLSGGIVGFFLHNCPPASVYLGDTGSMFLGLMLGTVMLQSCASPENTLWVCAPFAAALVPAVDVLLAVIRRANLGRHVFSPDRGHIHHLLYQKFSSKYFVLLFITLLVLPGCIGAVSGTFYRNDSIPFFISAVVLGIALVNDLFGQKELLILFGKIKGLLYRRFDVQHYKAKDGETYRIQGKGPWRQLWSLLVADAQKRDCRQCHLSIHMPYCNENFFANWDNPDEEPYSRTALVCNIDLTVRGRCAGTLQIAFDTKSRNRRETLQAVAQWAKMCEKFIEQKVENFPVKG